MGSTAIIEINKYDLVEKFLTSDDIVKRYQKERGLFDVPLKILMQVSEKEYLNDYIEEDYKRFFEAFIWSPSGITKKTGVLKDFNSNFIDISEAFKNNELDEEDLEIQSETTLMNKIAIVNNFLKFAVKNQFLQKNFIDGDSKYGKDKIQEVAKAMKTREPYKTEELSKMLKLFIEHNFFNEINIAYFYIPMIGMFTGMRLEEICKLRKSDFIKHDNVYCIDVNGDVKTSDSLRKIPIHSFLLKNLRLLKYVESREDRIFDLPKIVINGKPRYSKKYIPVYSNFRDEFVSVNGGVKFGRFS